MTERPRFLDDLAGVAGGAFSAIAGMRDEAEALLRGRVEEVLRRLDLVKRDELEAVQDLAAAARAGQEAAEVRLAALEARVAAAEARMATMETSGAGLPHVGDAPGEPSP